MAENATVVTEDGVTSVQVEFRRFTDEEMKDLEQKLKMQMAEDLLYITAMGVPQGQAWMLANMAHIITSLLYSLRRVGIDVPMLAPPAPARRD